MWGCEEYCTYGHTVSDTILMSKFVILRMLDLNATVNRYWNLFGEMLPLRLLLCRYMLVADKLGATKDAGGCGRGCELVISNLNVATLLVASTSPVTRCSFGYEAHHIVGVEG